MEMDIFNFEEILRPYRSAGTKSKPVQMTMETLAGALIITNKVPADIAGAVIFQTCYDIVHNGLHFRGNGQYGAGWHEMFNHIRSECLRLMQKGAANDAARDLMNQYSCAVRRCESRTRRIGVQSRWQKVKMFFFVPRLSFVGFGAAYILLMAIYFAALYNEEIIALLSGK